MPRRFTSANPARWALLLAITLAGPAVAADRVCCRALPVAGAELHSRFAASLYAGLMVGTSERHGMHVVRGGFAEAGYGLNGEGQRFTLGFTENVSLYRVFKLGLSRLDYRDRDYTGLTLQHAPRGPIYYRLGAYGGEAGGLATLAVGVGW